MHSLHHIRIFYLVLKFVIFEFEKWSNIALD